ncbi:unnamed protein product [Cyclocybe aegerita]|uniref:Uncharacterized protein n=1 Tax=Cyclocybe aegerita TaxID=1973307 RepID=A0A8S0WKW5_CYCAE|nr:unnamed protein product [Cyclocybe aegerita]
MSSPPPASTGNGPPPGPLSPTVVIGFYVFDRHLGFVSTIISCIVYGLIVALFFDCLHHLLRKPSRNSWRKKAILVGYIMGMVLMSTVGLVLSSLIMTRALFYSPEDRLLNLLGKAVVIPYILASWGADGMMIWRCLILYEGIAQNRFNFLLGLLGLLVLVALGSGILFVVLIFRTERLAASIFMVILPCATSLTNVAFASLISFRLLWHQKRMRDALGWTYGSPYTRTINICIESCSLIIVASVAFLALRIKNQTAAAIPEMLLIHASVISPLLIIQRVAKATDAVTTINTRDAGIRVGVISGACDHSGRVSTIRFNSEYSSEHIP